MYPYHMKENFLTRNFKGDTHADKKSQGEKT